MVLRLQLPAAPTEGVSEPPGCSLVVLCKRPIKGRGATICSVLYLRPGFRIASFHDQQTGVT